MTDKECHSKNSEKYKGTLFKEEPYDPEYDRAHQYSGTTSFREGQHPATAVVEKRPVPKTFISNTSNKEAGTETENGQSVTLSAVQPNSNILSEAPIANSDSHSAKKYDGTRIKEEPHDTDRIHHHAHIEARKYQLAAHPEKNVLSQSLPSNGNSLTAAVMTKCEQSCTLSVGESLENCLEDKEISVSVNKSKTFDRSGSNILSQLAIIKTEPPDLPCQDGGHDAAPHLDGVDPVKMWTVTSSHVVPLHEAESRPVQATSVHENICTTTHSLIMEDDEEALPQSTMRMRHETSCQLHLSAAGQVKRIHEMSTFDIIEECCDIAGEIITSEKEGLTCDFCLSRFPSKIVLESHQCKSAIYYCKICCMESTRRRRHALMPLPVAQHHFRLHLCLGGGGERCVKWPDSDVVNACKYMNHFLEELKGKAALLNSDEENVVFLQDLYTGIFQPGEE